MYCLKNEQQCFIHAARFLNGFKNILRKACHWESELGLKCENKPGLISILYIKNS